ncbi:hypothetical protein [Planomicrobium sp. YIM 101495]|uniref:hypothetical protein n=1 Tax=Planomicrobium sp. YIM 101495 TaxID=2665160 RepID=UPI0012B804F2|nr:hypothetical protein [Planomicrobium sp. YIM 101495]MTD31417.1 hypothetical protein [Planomicrobium sp. YIM 101495]
MEDLMKLMLAELQDFRKETNRKLDRLEAGQNELKDIMRHHSALTAENLTDIRLEVRGRQRDVEADVNLLFKELESVKRQTNKIDHMFRI